MISRLHSYTEEGVRCYPEIVITTNLEALLSPLPSRQSLSLGQGPVERVLPYALKVAAPLARNGWTIFLEIDEAEVRFGVVSVESTELSASLRSQVVGVFAPEQSPAPVLYIRARGAGTVELAWVGDRASIAVKLGVADGAADELQAAAALTVGNGPTESRSRMISCFVCSRVQ